MKYILPIMTVIALYLVFSTGGADVVTHRETDVLELDSTGEGTYTQINDDTGEIQLVLTEENPNVDGDGVNGNAITDIGPVFTIENVLDQHRQATVWIDHDSVDITFYAPGNGQIESQEEGVTLQPGESMTVALRVDTHETDEITLESIRVLATLAQPAETPDRTDEPTDSTDTSTETSTPADGDGSKPTKKNTPTPTVIDTPIGNDSSTASPTATSTPADGIEEEAGVDSWLLAALLALVAAIGSCTFLARRYGYI